jgi:regulator of sigma E protease
VTGIIIFIFLVYSRGETYFSRDQIIEHGIVAYEIGQQIGLQDGDKVLDVNGQIYESLNDLSGGDALLSSDGYYTVERDGERIKVPIPRGFINSFSNEESMMRFISIRSPFEINNVDPESSAANAGLKPGDRILEVDGIDTYYMNEFRNVMESRAGREVELLVERDGETLYTKAQISDDGTIGMIISSVLEPVRKHYTFAQSIPLGTERAFSVVIVNARAMGKMFTGEVSTKNVSGPIGMAKIYGSSWDWTKFWSITGLISMILAFMNFLPIPALDGGHVMFLLYEMVSGRTPSDRFLENAQKIGMVLLLAIMVFAIGNDILKIFTGS